jgi:hypothetical protein
VTIPIDDIGAAATRSMQGHLTAVLAAGGTRTILPIDPAGHVQVDFLARRALLLLSLRRALDGHALIATGTPDGGAALPALRFQPWSDVGSELPLYRPPREAGVEACQPSASASP